MKLGIITDIHSNINALKAVLNEFDKKQIDKIICCGDIIGIGANPEETVQELIKRREQLIAVRGNHEQYLLKGIPKNTHDDKRQLFIEEIQNHEWTHSRLSDKSKEFLKDLPADENIQLENKEIYVVHYSINQNGEYKKHIKNPTVEENSEMFNEIDADIFLYGHTHTLNVINANGKMYINSGPLGCPMDTNIANAVILEINKNEVSFQYLKIEYDVEEVIKEIKKLEYPFYNKVLKTFYGNR